jgi:hypothetical protein
MAVLEKVSKTRKDSGVYLNLGFATTDGRTFTDSFLVEPAPSRPDLRRLSVDALERLLDFFAAALGVDEVEDLAAALKDATGKAVMVETKQRKDRGQTRVSVAAFWAVPGNSSSD